jgi:hypothetical protein
MIEVKTRVTKFHRVDDSPDGAVVDGTKSAMKEAAGAGFQKSQDLVPTDTSELLMSGIPPYEDERGNIVWAYDAPHTLPVEYGSRPHWVPIEPLLGWARRVLGDESAAYAVRQKIANVGTDPQPFVRPGVHLQRLVLKGTGVATHIRDEIPGL